jgi:hypothetical protein
MKKIAIMLIVLGLVIPAMADYNDRVVYSENGEFRGRISYAMKKAALDVRAEAPSGDTAKRQALATRILDGAENMNQWAVAVTTNATIGAAIDANPTAPVIPDADIQFTVESLYNAFAGVYTP